MSTDRLHVLSRSVSSQPAPAARAARGHLFGEVLGRDDLREGGAKKERRKMEQQIIQMVS